MKSFLITFFIILSLFLGFLFKSSTSQNNFVLAAATSCTGSSNKATVAPGETFEVTVDFSDNKSHSFRYFLEGTQKSPGTNQEISEIIQGTTDPFTFSITAPDQFFSAVRISDPIGINQSIECFANVKSSLAPPSSSCQYDFNPKSVDGGAAITVTVTNTLKDYQYTAVIRKDRKSVV